MNRGCDDGEEREGVDQVGGGAGDGGHVRRKTVHGGSGQGMTESEKSMCRPRCVECRDRRRIAWTDPRLAVNRMGWVFPSRPPAAQVGMKCLVRWEIGGSRPDVPLHAMQAAPTRLAVGEFASGRVTPVDSVRGSTDGGPGGWKREEQESTAIKRVEVDEWSERRSERGSGKDSRGRVKRRVWRQWGGPAESERGRIERRERQTDRDKGREDARGGGAEGRGGGSNGA
nr:hypothetical protein CFP56_65527 [Quercus suber]